MKVQELLTTLNGLSDEQKQQEVSGRFWSGLFQKPSGRFWSGRFLWRINRWLKLKLFWKHLKNQKEKRKRLSRP